MVLPQRQSRRASNIEVGRGDKSDRATERKREREVALAAEARGKVCGATARRDEVRRGRSEISPHLRPQGEEVR